MMIAKEIANQIGNKALYMIGAKQLVAGENFLMFKIGRNAKGVNKVKITLNSMDTYDVEFLSVRGVNCKLKSEERGIYNDMLRGAIERNTGLYTSL